MAEAVLEIVLDNLSSLIRNELGLFLGFHQDLNRLSSTLTAIKATLEDAEEKQFSNRAIKDWLHKLKDAAHILDDILDDCATQALEFQHHGQADKVQCSSLSSFHPKRVVFRYKIAKKMKRIRERLDAIAEERIQFHLTEIPTERRTEIIDWRQTTSTIAQPQIYGREKDKDRIVDFLVGDASNFEDLSVFPILGMGGLGKTTLAQLIFNHERVVNHFEQRIWVCVSEDFSLKRMLKAIIQSSGHSCEESDEEPLQRRLQELLRSKRYLLVLDDVWDDKQDNWERLKCVLACGAKGTSILVTTRLTKVASIMGTVSPHQLSMLSENDCWGVFKQRAFGPNEVEHKELVVIGKEIVNKCGGVPLAAKALGSLLRFKREEKDWLYVKESKLWRLTEDENSVMAALRLSYLNLPIKLRQCFAFCALFPKDTEIKKHFLIDLWVANGFISSNEILEAEDIGDEVCNELYWRSFFQDIETDEFGKIRNLKMHDLVHDLAQSIAEDVCHITDDNDVTSVSERIRHISIGEKRLFNEVDSIELHQVKSLRTCIIQRHSSYRLPIVVLRCYSLRVLHCKWLDNLSSSIDNLKHLRYLNLSHGHFKTLPESLCKLLNLQILNLDNCYHLEKLPNRLKCLKALRHLCLTGCDSLSSLPPEIGELTFLRNLSMYIVGRQRGFLLAELGRLNLKGGLHIKHLERVKSVTDAKDANMGSKQLNELVLSWDINEESQVQENVEQILEVLQPHPQQLQTLKVRGYRGVQFPEWMASPCLKYLNFVTLVDCESCLHLPPLGKLLSLKILRIFRLPNLTRLSREDGESMFQCLSILDISDCPKLLALPCLPSLKRLRISKKCSQDLLSSIHKSSTLEFLSFEETEELGCFPDGMLQDLTSLKTLEFAQYSKLEVLPPEIMNLNAIQTLCFRSCDSLEILTEQVLQGLHSLKELEIGSCDKFNFSSGFQYLTSLEWLHIDNCPRVEGFPATLQHMTSLQTLILFHLHNLRSLPHWLGNIALLDLHIADCPKLMCLPMSIPCLSALKTLTIKECPELEKRCKKEIGEDWPKIAHIPYICVHGEGSF